MKTSSKQRKSASYVVILVPMQIEQARLEAGALVDGVVDVRVLLVHVDGFEQEQLPNRRENRD